MFHYRTGKINTAPLSSAATTHFFIISYIFHFCRAASAPGSRAKKKTPTYKNLHRCYSVVKPRTDFQTGTNFPSAAKVAAQPGSAPPKWGRAAAPSTGPTGTSAGQGKPLRRAQGWMLQGRQLPRPREASGAFVEGTQARAGRQRSLPSSPRFPLNSAGKGFAGRGILN